MIDANPVTIPLETSIKLTKAAEDDRNLINPTLYRQIIGSLMYLSIATRPDLAASISILSQFSSRPNQSHFATAKRLLRYLKGTMNYALHLGGSIESETQEQLQLFGYSDAN